MAFISNLLAMSEPKGFWITIVKAFEGVTGNYILAIIFLTVIIRLIFSAIDVVNKYNSSKMSEVQAKMQPEEDKIRAKYAQKPEVMQQKLNELKNKYYGKEQYAGCIIMLIGVILNMAILVGLWGGLNQISAYKIYENYDNIKYTYANCLNVADKYYTSNEAESEPETDKLAKFKDYKNLKFVIKTENNKKIVSLVYQTNDNEEVLHTEQYISDFSSEKEVLDDQTNESTTVKVPENENIIALINKYYKVGEKDGTYQNVVVDTFTDEEGQQKNVYLPEVINTVINKEIVSVYDATQDKFLWIQNIWIPDSPAYTSIVSYDKLSSQVGGFEKDEEIVYNAFMPQLKAERSKTNGYFITTVLCILASFLSMLLAKVYSRYIKKEPPKLDANGNPVKNKGRWAQLIMPVIFGILAMFYNSVFAIYMLAGQLVSCVLLIPQLYIVDLFAKRRKNKKKEENTVDYSRKF